MLATGFWVDFSKDVPAFWRSSDVVKLYDLAGARSELQRLPLRLVHAGVAAAGAYLLARDYADVFDDGAGAGTLLVPVATGSF